MVGQEATTGTLARPIHAVATDQVRARTNSMNCCTYLTCRKGRPEALVTVECTAFQTLIRSDYLPCLYRLSG